MVLLEKALTLQTNLWNARGEIFCPIWARSLVPLVPRKKLVLCRTMVSMKVPCVVFDSF